MFIYRITNKINGKIYIGQTTGSLKKRWTGHCSKAFYEKSQAYVHNAIRKYGKENFTIEEIGGANNLSELNYLETHYIYKFNSLAPNGYNLKTGGNNTKHGRDTILKLMNCNANKKVLCINNNIIYKSISEASRKLNITRKSINDNVMGKTDTAHGMVFEFIESDLKNNAEKRRGIRKNKRKENIDNQKQSIMCVENGKVYKSIKEAALDLKITTCNINSVLSGNQVQSKGFTFRYKCSDREKKRLEKRSSKMTRVQITEKTKKVTSKPVRCLNNGIIYSSIKDASVDLNIHHNSIRNMLSGRAKTAGGLMFKYQREKYGKPR